MRALRRNRSGTATVEFAIIAPVLVSLLFSVCDLTPSILARFKAGNSTFSVADVTSQYSVVLGSDLVNIFAAGADAMAPYPSANFSLRISNIGSDGAGNAVVYWSCANGTYSPLTATSRVTTTPTATPIANLLNTSSAGANTSFIMVEASYLYTAPAQFLMKTAQTINAYAYSVPRNSAYIIPSNGDPNWSPAGPASIQFYASYPLGNGINCTSGF